MRGLVWFKKDLRVHDHPALFHASQACEDGVVAVYIIDRDMWAKHSVSSVQIDFIIRGLTPLFQDLHKLNIPLFILEATSTEDIFHILKEIIDQHAIDSVYMHYEYEVNESRRDALIIQKLQASGVKTTRYHDQLILPYEAIKTGQGSYFKVFTAFKRRWLSEFAARDSKKLLPLPKKNHQVILKNSTLTPHCLTEVNATVNSQLWPVGETIARQRLKTFLETSLYTYHQQRDFPNLDSTSHLSPYIAVGMISVRECFIKALEANSFELDTGSSGALTWMSELIWREFYRHILIHEPRVCMNRAFKQETEALHWNSNKEHLNAWKQGKTGFPIVDAAMRQLNQIGWMHNRLRMITAMFLSKMLFLDWRLGEAYFAEQLIDFDFASNNGGWQWSASTGTDAVPYFRIFNPTTQSQRFDPDGNFIRRYCPELNALDAVSIHQPYEKASLIMSTVPYPKPIIDYKTSRQKAITAFKNLKI